MQQSVPFKCILHKTDVACCSGLDEAFVVISGNRPLKIFVKKK